MTAKTVETSLGKRPVDREGPPVGVVLLDPEQTYTGVGELLQAYLNQQDEAAWEKIKAKIDYTCQGMEAAFAPLIETERLKERVHARLSQGQKLLFKPNLVSVSHIDGVTHGPGAGSLACTEWAFVAALMRWFHDRLGVRYDQMSLGEAATAMTAAARATTMAFPPGMTAFPEALIEGKIGDYVGGWGFYFVRRYLAERLSPGASEDPMRGYEESVTGNYLPPGRAGDRLMVYDLNRIHDNPSRGREVPVRDGVNFPSILIHKAVVGGDPSDPADREAYPGAILVNVPRLKVHALTLFTNVIKNLGIGLYPMQAARTGAPRWDYSLPHADPPGIKGGIPHQVWEADVDPNTGWPCRDASGKYRTRKTGGLTSTMVDIVRAVADQDVLMVHVVDGVEPINLDHQGAGVGEKNFEGLIAAGLDPVAVDLLCARYLFGNVGYAEALKAGLEDGAGGRFAQVVPLPRLDNGRIVTGQGHDCPLSRDRVFATAERRGLGMRPYRAQGRDVAGGRDIVSVEGHLGTVDKGVFTDLITRRLYYDILSFPWHLQRTALAFLEATDALAGASRRREFLEAFDEDGDGVVTFEEFGKKGVVGLFLHVLGRVVHLAGSRPLGGLAGGFAMRAQMIKGGEALWNAEGHDLMKEYNYGFICMTAFRMSQLPISMPDPFSPGLIFGQGLWPSFDLAKYVYTGMALYGDQFPTQVSITGLFGTAFTFADLTQNNSVYTGLLPSQPNPEGLKRYFGEVAGKGRKPLDFTLYVPAGFGQVAGAAVPNVEVTDDPGRVLTVEFAGGAVW
jgi:hypothetical protein